MEGSNEISSALLQGQRKISPMEFVYLWNLLLKKIKGSIKSIDTLPMTLLVMEYNEILADNLSFTIGRINSDHEFTNEVISAIGFPVKLKLECAGDIRVIAGVAPNIQQL